MARTPPPVQQELLDRLRDLLAGSPVTREVSTVEPSALAADDQLAWWLGPALEYNRSVTGGTA